MMRRLLFVDDEPMLLQGLQRSLRPMRRDWEMEFIDNGIDALAALERSPFDVIITDMRMPNMDGAQLLEQVKVRFPRTVRFVLSGQSSREVVLRSIAPAHQYLSKPCDIDELKQKLSRALALQDLLHNPAIKEVVSQLHNVPSPPTLYLQITAELQSPDISIGKIASTIAQDMGMAAKILQVINSAFFNVPQYVSSPAQAVSLLGVDNVRALVLSVHIFSALDSKLAGDLSVLWKHSLSTANYAKAIAHCQSNDQKVAGEAFTAGLLHDIGVVVLASSFVQRYRNVLQKATTPLATWKEEQEEFGCSHGEIGAYLLGLWGLPDPVVEAVAWHHQPSQANPHAFCPLVAVHVADRLHYRMALPDREDELDRNLIDQLGLQNQIPVWEQICAELEQA
jgi:putative nucleotidyltransferase with HDIG domain